jgi:hypothetical protein
VRQSDTIANEQRQVIFSVAMIAEFSLTTGLVWAIAPYTRLIIPYASRLKPECGKQSGLLY